MKDTLVGILLFVVVILAIGVGRTFIRSYVGGDTEAQAKASFMSGCLGESGEYVAYCECAWTNLREEMSVEEIDRVGMLPEAQVIAKFQHIIDHCFDLTFTDIQTL